MIQQAFCDGWANRVFTGDCLDVMAEMPPHCVDLIVTSPPYPGQRGNKMSFYEWWDFMVTAIKGMRRVLKDEGVLCLNVMLGRAEGWFDMRLFGGMAEMLNECRLSVLDVYIYGKKNPVPSGALTRCDIPAWEPVFICTWADDWDGVCFVPQFAPHAPKSKSKSGLVSSKWRGRPLNPKGARQTNLMLFSSSGPRRPRARGISFPCEMAERMIKQYSRPGDVVLDPFFGVGTTGVAAQRNGRWYVGIELNASEADKARAWLASDDVKRPIKKGDGK